MKQKEIIIIADYQEPVSIPLDELRRLYDISDAFIEQLIEHDIIQVEDKYVFDQAQLKRLQAALRLQRDLEVNMPGIALVLDLMDELNTLRARAEFLERHIFKS